MSDDSRCVCRHVFIEHDPETAECDVCGCDNFEWDGEPDDDER